MKKKLISLLLLLLLITLVGCGKEAELKIEGSSTLEIGFSEEYKVYLGSDELKSDDYMWTISDRSLIINNGNTFTPLKEGICDITAVLKSNGEKVAKFSVTIVDALIKSVSIYSNEGSTLYVDDFVNLEYKTNPTDAVVTPVWESSNESVATVDQDGLLTAISKGTATITVTCGKAVGTLDITVKEVITEVVAYLPSELVVGQAVDLKTNLEDPVYALKDDSDNEISELLDNKLFAKKVGIIKLSVKSKSEPTLAKTFNIEVVENKSNTIEYDKSEYESEANSILEKMSITQKIGQYVFASTGAQDLKEDTDGVYFQETGTTKIGKTYISDFWGGREFGNFIYSNFGWNDPLDSLSYFQKIAKYNSQIGGFAMMYDSTCAGTSTFTTQISSRGLGNLTKDEFTQYCSNYAKELKELGVNLYFTYGFNKNDEDECFSTETVLNNYYSTLLINAFHSEGLMVGFTFTSLGNEESDRVKDKDTLIQMVNNNVDMIGIEKNIENFDGNLSLVEYLRKTLNYTGLIYFDIVFTSYNFEEGTEQIKNDIINAMNDGVDLFYVPVTINQRSWNNSNYNEIVFALYDEIIEAYNNKIIKEETIEAAAKRIVLKKLEYDLIDGSPVVEELSDFTSYDNYAASLYKSTYYVSEDYQALDKNKHTVIIGQSIRQWSMYGRGDKNDFATALKKSLTSEGFSDITVYKDLNKDYQDTFDDIKKNKDTQLVIFMTYSEYSFSYKETVTEEGSEEQKEVTKMGGFKWSDVVKEFYDAGITDITIVVLYDLSTATSFDYINNKVCANYNYTEDYSALIDVVIDGK